MAVCPNCNTVNEDGAGFCTGCGNALTHQESLDQQPVEQAPAQQENVLEGQTPNEILSDLLSGVIEQAQSVEEMPEMPPKKKGKEKWFLFGGIGVVVAAAIAVGAMFLPKLFGKDKKVEQVFYVKDGSLFYRDLDGKESLELSGKINKDKDDDNTPRVIVNADQTRVFYAEKIEEVQEEPGDEYSYAGTYYKYDLCYVDLNKKKAEPQTLASDVTYFEINAAGTKVAYQTEDDTLYIHDLKEEEKIDKNVSGVYANKDMTRIGYQKEDKLYLWEEGKDSEKIASDVEHVRYVDADVTYVFYTDKEQTLYTQELGKDAVKVAENVYNVYATEGKAVYYTAVTEGKSSLADYVEDDMAEADKDMTEPEWPEREDYPEYPSRPYSWDYESDEEYQAAMEQYEKDKEAYDAEVKRIDEAYDAAVEKYYQDQEVYDKKQNRDQIREELKTYESYLSLYSMYYYDGKEATLLTDSMTNGWYDSRAYDADLFMISVTSLDGMEKVKLSEVEYIWDVEDQVRQAMYESEGRALVSGKTMTKLELKDAYSVYMTDDGSAIWYVSDVKTENIDVGEGNGPDKETAPEGNLYKIAVKDGKPGKAEKYDEKVYAGDISVGVNGEVAYYKDVEMKQEEEYYSYGIGTLYINKTEVEKDIRCGSANYTEELKTWVILTNQDEETNAYDISFYKDGELVEIAEGVIGVTMVPGGDFVYLCDWDEKDECGTLYSYNNGKPVEIDTEVQALVSVQFMEK